jgi:hypothetical protein
MANETATYRAVHPTMAEGLGTLFPAFIRARPLADRFRVR